MTKDMRAKEGNMKPGPVLSEADALMLLNFELSAYEECADCRFNSVGPVKPARDACDRKTCSQVLDEVCTSFRVAAPAGDVPAPALDPGQNGSRPER
jgi:hypothetical protein